MADVQLEKGYTRLANSILENMAKIKLSPTQYRILFVVWRYTYGFKRKEHDLSLSFLSEATGCNKRHIQRELKLLEEKNVIHQTVKHGSFRKISFNKNYTEWGTVGEIDNTQNQTVGEIDDTAIGEIDDTTVGEIDNQERKNLKKNIKKDDDMKNNPFNEYEKNFGILSSGIIEEFNYWIDESQFTDPEGIICEVIKRAKLQSPRNPAKYIAKILKDLHNMELFTLSAVIEHNKRFDNKVKLNVSKHNKQNGLDIEKVMKGLGIEDE